MSLACALQQQRHAHCSDQCVFYLDLSLLLLLLPPSPPCTQYHVWDNSAKCNQTLKRNDRNLKSGLATGVDIHSVSVTLLSLNGRWYQLSVHHTLEWRLI